MWKLITNADGTISKAKLLSILTALVGLAMSLGVRVPDWLTTEQLGGIATVLASLLVHFVRSGVDKGPTQP